MKWKSWLFGFLKFTLSLAAGVSIGIFVFSPITIYLLCPWKSTVISPPLNDASEIMSVYYGLTSDDSTQDIVYVRTRTDNIYSVFQGAWTLLPPIEQGYKISQIHVLGRHPGTTIIAETEQGQYFQLLNGAWEIRTGPGGAYQRFESEKCATEWNIHPRIKGRVLDSDGFAFEHSMGTAFKCYVLFEDGTLQIWTLSWSVFQSMMSLIIGLGMGISIGVLGGVFLIYFTKQKTRARVKTPPNTGSS